MLGIGRFVMNIPSRRLADRAQAQAARRRHLALLVEQIEQIERTPVRDAEQAKLKKEALAALLETETI